MLKLVNVISTMAARHYLGGAAKNLVTSEVAKGYSHTIKDLRYVTLGILILLFVGPFFALSFCAILFSTLILSEMDIHRIALIGAIVGGVFFIGIGVSVWALFRESLWIKTFKIDDLIEKVRSEQA